MVCSLNQFCSKAVRRIFLLVLWILEEFVVDCKKDFWKRILKEDITNKRHLLLASESGPGKAQHLGRVEGCCYSVASFPLRGRDVFQDSPLMLENLPSTKAHISTVTPLR